MRNFKIGNTNLFILTSLFFLFFSGKIAQDKILKVWTNGIPGSIEKKDYKEELVKRPDDIERISKVSEPTISVYLPPKEKSTGTAVVIRSPFP